MSPTFDKDYWDQIWAGARAGAMSTSGPNPHLVAEVGDLKPDTALDAGCGAGAEAIWLAARGWSVTAVEVADAALAVAEERAAQAGPAGRVRWVLADLGTWRPETTYDLVTTHYAHPSIGQLEFYERISDWVSPGGTLLIVGHLRHHGHGDHDHHAPPEEATVSATDVTGILDPATWDVVTAREVRHADTFDDVVVRATRRR